MCAHTLEKGGVVPRSEGGSDGWQAVRRQRVQSGQENKASKAVGRQRYTKQQT